MVSSPLWETRFSLNADAVHILPETARTAVFHGPGKPLTLESIPVPEPGPGEVLVRNEFVTLCRSDVNTFAGRTFGPDDLEHEDPFDVILECSGAPTAVSASIRNLATGGVAIWVGGTFPQPALMLNPEDIIRRLITIRGLHNYNDADLMSATDFFEQHYATYPFGELVDDAFTLDTVQEAFRRACDGTAHRVGVRI